MSDKARLGSDRPIRTWKRIARYLERDVRTVQRWEKESRLPVHRVPGRRSVFAYRQELDDWLQGGGGAGSPTSPRPRDLPRMRLFVGSGVGSVFLVAALLAVWVGGGFGRGDGLPLASRVEVRGGMAVGVDRGGKVVWTKLNPEGRALIQSESQSAVLFGDDGPRLILATNRLGVEGENVFEGELSAFTPGGDLLWRRRVRETLRFASGSFGRPWVSGPVRALRLGGDTRVAWVVHHFNWWPSMLFLYDRDGRLEGRFVHSGWITALASRERADGDQLLAGGISNGGGGAMLAVLDGAAVTGAYPTRAGSPFTCLDCPGGGPIRYFVFPPSHVNRGHGLPYNATASVHVTPELTRVIVVEGPPGTYVQWVYDFTPSLELLRITPSDAYWAEHDRLFGEGHLNHPSSSCPERDSRFVREWRPDLGWRRLSGADSAG